ncbi:uncharacterized protein M421DRAFT_31073, partial [Didymella exigua CBS 183.55]
KTQIANEYVHRLAEKQDGKEAEQRSSIFWIYANTQARVEHSFKHIAQELNLVANKDLGIDVIPIVRDWMQNEHTGPWVLVIDNADDENVFFSP